METLEVRDYTDELSHNVLLSDLPLSIVERFAARATPVFLTKGETLWQQGQPATQLSFIIHGRVLIERVDRSGYITFYHVCGERDVVGLASLIEPPSSRAAASSTVVHRTCVRARVDSSLLRLPSHYFIEYARHDSYLWQRVLWYVHLRMSTLEDELFEERVHRGERLIAAKLVRLASMEGHVSGSVFLAYSQSELALFMKLGARNIQTLLRRLPGVRTAKGRRGLEIASLEALRVFARIDV